MPEVSILRFLGKADYASRILLPNMLYLKFLTSPHPHAKIKSIDTSEAEKMPGIAFILTHKNAPKTYPLPEELKFQGEVVAIVAADTEDLAEDAVETISVQYDVLHFASTLQQVLGSGSSPRRTSTCQCDVAATCSADRSGPTLEAIRDRSQEALTLQLE